MERTPLLEVKNLKQYFKVSKKFTVKAVDGISFNIYPGETYGLVGESGSGKSTTGRSIIRLYEPTDGEVNFKGVKISGKLSLNQLQHLRTKMQMIFQDPMACLNPRMKVIDIIAQGLDIHKLYKNEKEREEKVYHILELVGLSHEHAMRYPHQFSGGMKQRVVIAIALACNPKLLIADEPTTALDVTIQAQVLDLMNDLKEKFKTAMILITHDLGVVAQVCDKVAIMYAGEIIEAGTLLDVFENPKHPYTHGLFGSIPSLDEETTRLKPIQGLMPDPTDLPKGCKFHPRCPHATELCSKQDPNVVEVTEGHKVRCLICEGLVEFKEEQEDKK